MTDTDPDLPDNENKRILLAQMRDLLETMRDNGPPYDEHNRLMRIYNKGLREVQK